MVRFNVSAKEEGLSFALRVAEQLAGATHAARQTPFGYVVVNVPMCPPCHRRGAPVGVSEGHKTPVPPIGGLL